jgi:hypothetical protein
MTIATVEAARELRFLAIVVIALEIVFAARWVTRASNAWLTSSCPERMRKPGNS